MKKFVFAALALVMMLACCAGAAEQTAAALNVGDHFVLGNYEQDNDLTNGKEPIEWRVLQIENGELLAISLYALDSQPYNTRGGHARWNTASLRDWLSYEFYNAAFGDDEKQVIITKELENWKEQNTTGDPVTLITCDEAKQLFANHEDRMCTPTDYCVAQGARLSTKFRKDKDGYYNVNWWTRNHSWESNARGSYVANSGGVMTCGGNKDGTASNKKIAVRPAVYFDVQALSQMLGQAAAQ